VIEAAFWGGLGASALLLGAVVAFLADVPKRVQGLILAFGAGTLIGAVAYELVEEAVRISVRGIDVAIGFGVGATAFGMTLRPEPAIALLVVAILACCIRYLRSPGLEPLVVAILLAGLALTIHPAGAVALAPLLVCARRVISDALRREGVTILEVAVLISIGAASA